MQIIDPLVKEKTEYKKLKFLYELWFTFGHFSLLLKTLLIVFVIGFIPVYFLTKYISLGVSYSSLLNVLVEARKPSIIASSLKTGSVKLLVNGSGTYAAFAELENPNLDLSASQVNYQFDFYGDSGSVIKTQTGNTFVEPGQKKFIIAPRIESDKYLKKVEFKINSSNLVKRFEVPKIQLTAGTPQYYNQLEPAGFVVEGLVFNNSPYSLKSVQVKFLLYSNSGEVLAVSQREENSMAPFERRAYKQIWPNIYTNQISRVEVFPETNILDRNNLRLQNY